MQWGPCLGAAGIPHYVSTQESQLTRWAGQVEQEGLSEGGIRPKALKVSVLF